MSKNIAVISTSFRKGGNTDTLADEFIRGALSAGHTAEKIVLYDKQIAFCRGCLNCLKTQRCIINDDVPAITEKVKNADIVVWATPVYYYGMCGQMKTLMDRMNALYTAEYAFRDVYVLAASAEDSPAAMDGTVKGVQGWVDCYPKSRLKNVLRAAGVSNAGEIREHKEFLEQAYQMGRSV